MVSECDGVVLTLVVVETPPLFRAAGLAASLGFAVRYCGLGPGEYWLQLVWVSKKRSSSAYELNLTMPCAEGTVKKTDSGSIPKTVTAIKRATLVRGFVLFPLQ